MKKKNKLKEYILLTALSIGLIGGAYAYFSAIADTVPNIFKVFTGEQNEDGGIKIIEPSWVGNKRDGENKVLSAGAYLAKDPSVESQVNYDGYAIMRVRIPKVMSIEKNQKPSADGQLNEQLNEIATICWYDSVQADPGDLLTPEDINGEPLGIVIGDNEKGTYNSEDFVFLGKLTSRDPYNDYYFGYKEILKAGERTSNLFDYMRIKEFTKLIDDDAKSIKRSIDIDARLMQTLDEDSGTIFENVTEVWEKMYKKPASSEEFGAVDE